jgi:hypothetical protein
MRNVVFRVLSKHLRAARGGPGPSWLSLIGHATDSLSSVDLFRCEPIVLPSCWVLVVMDRCGASVWTMCCSRMPVILIGGRTRSLRILAHPAAGATTDVYAAPCLSTCSSCIAGQT